MPGRKRKTAHQRRKIAAGVRRAWRRRKREGRV